MKKNKKHIRLQREREREIGKYFLDGLPYLTFFKSLRVCLRFAYLIEIENFFFKSIVNKGKS